MSAPEHPAPASQAGPIPTPAKGNAGVETGRAETWDVAAAAGAWNCRCNADCSALDAVHCLYRTTLELLSGREEAAARCNALLRPLSAVVGRQKTRDGHRECTSYATALAQGDDAAALSACRRLIELEQAAASARARQQARASGAVA